MLWLALYCPTLALDCLLRRWPDGLEPAMAVSDVDGTRRFIAATTLTAQASGVFAGQSVATALALLPDLLVVARRIEDERRALTEAALAALRFTPTVSLRTSGLVLEISASLRLFGGRPALKKSLALAMRGQGLRIAAAEAPTPHGAWLLAKENARRRFEATRDALRHSRAPSKQRRTHGQPDAHPDVETRTGSTSKSTSTTPSDFRLRGNDEIRTMPIPPSISTPAATGRPEKTRRSREVGDPAACDGTAEIPISPSIPTSATTGRPATRRSREDGDPAACDETAEMPISPSIPTSTTTRRSREGGDPAACDEIRTMPIPPSISTPAATGRPATRRSREDGDPAACDETAEIPISPSIPPSTTTRRSREGGNPVACDETAAMPMSTPTSVSTPASPSPSVPPSLPPSPATPSPCVRDDDRLAHIPMPPAPSRSIGPPTPASGTASSSSASRAPPAPSRTTRIAFEAALDALPIGHLESLGPSAKRMRGIGLFTLADLRRLPAKGLARRFGPGLIDELARATGDKPDPQIVFEAPSRFDARLELMARVESAEALVFASQRLLGQLSGWLAARRAAVRRFTLVLHHDRWTRDAIEPTSVDIALATPSSDHARLLTLVRERLARLELKAPVLELALAAPVVVEEQETHHTLFPEREAAVETLARLLEKLTARLGPDATARIERVADHRPERAWREIRGDLLEARLMQDAARSSQRRTTARTPGATAATNLRSPNAAATTNLRKPGVSQRRTAVRQAPSQRRTFLHWASSQRRTAVRQARSQRRTLMRRVSSQRRMPVRVRAPRRRPARRRARRAPCPMPIRTPASPIGRWRRAVRAVRGRRGCCPSRCSSRFASTARCTSRCRWISWPAPSGSNPAGGTTTP